VSFTSGTCNHPLKQILSRKKYRVRRKGLATVIEELKQRILAKAAKITRYNQRIDQYRINRFV